MTDDMGNLGQVYRSIEDYLKEQRKPDQKARRMLASGRTIDGKCACGEPGLHAHGTVS